MSSCDDRAKPTTWAPSFANATALLPPIPRLAPVTTTTLPSNLFISSRGLGVSPEHLLVAPLERSGETPKPRQRRSSQFQGVHLVHVIKRLVLARHRPDELVRRRA